MSTIGDELEFDPSLYRLRGIQKNPKIIIGYSDVTAIYLLYMRKRGVRITDLP